MTKKIILGIGKARGHKLKNLNLLIPFVTTTSFSKMMGIKAKEKNTHCCKNNRKSGSISEMVSARHVF